MVYHVHYVKKILHQQIRLLLEIVVAIGLCVRFESDAEKKWIRGVTLA